MTSIIRKTRIISWGDEMSQRNPNPNGSIGDLKMNAKTVKTVNYTDEQTAKVVEAFKAVNGKMAKDAIDVLAASIGKSARSIIAKASREGVYSKGEPVTKTGEPVEHKEELATAIGAVLGLDEASASSLTKSNKKALQVIFAALANSKPI